jgi:hypothetical protein
VRVEKGEKTGLFRFVNRRLEVQFLSPAPYLSCMADVTRDYPSMIASCLQKHAAKHLALESPAWSY